MLNKLFYTEKLKKTVLVVDDEYINRELLGGMLEDDYNVIFAEDGEQALELIRQNAALLSVVLLDLLMPKTDGFAVLDIMKNDPSLHSIPVIVLTSETSAEVESLRRGAVDFIKKPYDVPEIVLARVQRIIELFEGRQMIQSTERDELTGLYSRSYFIEYASVMDRYQSGRQMDAVVVNVDGFHLINEIYGRDYGDRVLRELADIIQSYAHKNEGIAARDSADTFYLYQNHQTDYSELEREFEDGMRRLHDSHIKLRVGVYARTEAGQDMENSLDRARAACNTLRGNFRQTVAFFDEKMKHDMFFSQRLIYDIHEGIAQRQFEVYFQPKYAIQGERPVLQAAEALIRWKHPEFGMVSPFAFISLFEENGLISELDRFVWAEAAARIREWRDSYGITIPVSVNVSRIDIYDGRIGERIDRIIKDNGLSNADLHLEITESAYSENVEQLISVVSSFRDRGYLIELDDFGAGYSSLNMLTNLPIDVLKMDMKFMDNLTRDEKSRRMVQIIMEIADFLKLPVVAEGVEDEEQYMMLKRMGCDLIQGYYFSRPLPASGFEELIKKECSERG